MEKNILVNNSQLSTKIIFFQRLGAAAAEMEYGEAEGNFDIIIATV